jgi:hypothetical protein
MTQHNMCQCGVASMLAITATAWAQAPAEFPVSGMADKAPLPPSDRPIQLSSSVFEVRSRSLPLGCHALQGTRCNARVGKSPSE